MKPGQKAEVRVDGYGDQRFEAKVERINPATEQGSRSILIYLSLDNSAGLLRGGMFAQGELVIAESGEGPVVAVVDGKLQQKSVKLGLSTEDNALVEVREGLAAGDVVVVGRLDSLKPGTPVVLKTAAAPAAAGNGG